VARRPEACVRTPLSIRISARASFPRAGRGRDHHLAGGGSGPDDIGRTTKQWRSSNRCPAWRHPKLNCRRIECCLRHHPRPSAPSPHQAPPQPMSRARDMGPLPSRGARSAPQPRVRRNGEIRPKTDLSPYARMALAPGRQSPRVSETEAHRNSELCRQHRVPQSLTRRWIEQPIAGRRKEH
jgi:hypothetical protein